ncbi:MAG TPA: 6-phosphofructokinase [Egibacteraceae bacterium]|nr:6-phosphofructokinase [Egibacteraceae bacterium]
MKRIAVLTSGGDAPGMNAAVRAVVRAADASGVDVWGVRDGYAGMINGDIAPLDARAVSGILHLGGTMLGTARSERFRTEEGRREAIAHLERAEIEGLVVIGGDGSFRGGEALSRESEVRVVGVPGTIDNDLIGTDFTLGFDTAVNTALESIDRIRDTASSHGRLFYVEVMGRHSGWLALYSGLAGGATDVLVPERPTDLGDLRKRIRQSFDMGKRFCLIVVAEGDDAGGAYQVAQKVSQGLDVDYRVTTLGHVQRGGPPLMRDRVLGALLGDAAVTALLDGQDRVMVGQRHGEIVHTPLERTWTEHDDSPAELLRLMDRLAR